MKLVYLITHGPSEWDPHKKISGQSDVRLSSEGWNQARMIGNMLKSKTFNEIYSSEMDRAYATAKEISLHHSSKIIISQRLNDWNLGIWEGLTMARLKDVYDEKHRDWQKDPLGTRMTKGESLGEFIERVQLFYGSVLKKKAENIAVVSHRRVIMVLTCLLEGKDPRELSIEILPAHTDAQCRPFEIK